MQAGFFRWAIVAGALLVAGCMSRGDARRIDERLADGWQPSKAECAFGGATAAMDAHCAQVNFGPEGSVALLREANAEILQAANGSELHCQDHVAQARRALEPFGDRYATANLYSCADDAPLQDGRRVCHVSLLVTDAGSGRRFVVDNGSVLPPEVFAGVAAYETFARRVDYAWIGDVPPHVTLAARKQKASGHRR